MSDDFAGITGQGLEFEFEGQRYTLSPLTLRDLADFYAWIRGQKIAAIKQMQAEGLDVSSDMVDACLDPPSPQALTRWLSSPAGAQQLLYLSLRHKHPQIRPAKVAMIVERMDVGRLMDLILKISGLLTGAGEKEQGPQPGEAASGGAGPSP